MILSVRYPAPVTHVPKGMRAPRLAYVRDAVAAEIPEISATETVRVDLPDIEVGGLLHDGRLWRPLGVPGSPADAEALALVLEDGPGAGAHRALIDAIRHSPLGASRPDRDDTMFPPDRHPDRGGPPPDERRVRWDGTEAARRLARVFAQDTFLLVGGKAYVRLVPLAWVTPMDSPIHRGVHVAVEPDGLMRRLDRFPATPLTLAAAEESLAVPRGSAIRPAGLDDWSALPDTVFGEAAAEAVANALPGALRFRLDRDLGPDRRDGREAMAALEQAGWTRSVSGEALGPALAATAEACEHLDREGARPRNWDYGFARLARYVREAVAPGAGMPEADAEALSAFPA